MRCAQKHFRRAFLNGTLDVEARWAGVLRVRFTREPEFSTVPSWMVESPPPVTPLEAEEAGGILFLRTEELEMSVDPAAGRLGWRDRAGKPLLRTPARKGVELHPAPVRRARLLDVRTEQTVDGERTRESGIEWETVREAWQARLRFEFQPGEAVYGLGQHEQGLLNLRGSSEDLYQQNMKVAMPVLLSTEGWGILFDSYSLGCFRDDGHGSYYWSEVEDELEFYFLHGPSFDRIISGIRRLTGKAVLPPRWALGYVQSKERYVTGDELLEVAREFRRRELPLDVLVQDWQTWPEGMWGEKCFDPARFPDPAGMVAALHALDVRLMVSIWPVMRGGDNEREMRAAGHMLGEGCTYNALDPAARALYWKQAREAYFQHGTDAWWCDCTEPFEADWNGPVKPEPWRQLLVDTTEFKKYMDPEHINVYSLLHSKGLYENQLADAPDRRMLNLTRSAYPGQQRYGAVTWSGDTSAGWETLARQIPAGLNFCMSGIPWWTTDIGGFFTRRRPEFWFWDGDYEAGCDDPAYRELFLRWFQLGCFLPMFRAHGTDTPREPWRFGNPGEAVYDSLVDFLRLRYRLMPYFYSLAGWTYHRDYTWMRALVFDYPGQQALHDVRDQFMAGPALMVCPVLHPGAETRTVRFPEGPGWFDFWTGALIPGGQTLEVPAPLERMPLFAKAGSILPLGPAVTHTGEGLDAPWELRVYVGADAVFDVYEDAGEGMGYQRGECAWTRIRWEDARRTLHLDARSGDYPGLTRNRQFHLHLFAPGGQKYGGVHVYDGSPMEIQT